MSKLSLFSKIGKNTGVVFSKISLQVKRKSPEILLITGVAAIVTGTVLACMKTKNVAGIVEQKDKNIETIRQTAMSETHPEDNYDERKAVTMEYANMMWNFVKNYAIPGAVMGLGIAAIIGGHIILKKRNAALVAAYQSLDTAFKDYRKRVKEKYGEEIDNELYYNLKKQKIVTTDEETGEVTSEEVYVQEGLPSIYSQVFNHEYSTQWENNHEMNLVFLKSRERMMNDLFRARGHMFLNEIYDDLGFKRTDIGQYAGWIYDPKSDKRDNFISFGMLVDPEAYGVDRFVKPREDGGIVLDFNVDGSIVDEFTYKEGNMVIG